MVLFLYGPDTFRLKRKLDEIIKKYRLKYKSGLNFAKIEASEEGFEELKTKIETASMFEEKKLVVFKNALSLSVKFQEKIKEYLLKKNLFENKNLFLIFLEEGEARNKKVLFKILLKNSLKSQEFKKLPLFKLKRFIQEEVKKLEGRIHPRALEKMIFFYGSNLWQIDNEIRKLVAFKKGMMILSEDIENLGEVNLDPSIFETIEAISRKQKQKALKLILEHLKKGENELKILSMIVFQFRNLIKIKSILEENNYNLRSPKLRQQFWKSRIHPFVIKKTLPIAKNFSMEELKEIYKKLFEVDLKIKTGKVEPDLAIETFIMEL